MEKNVSGGKKGRRKKKGKKLFLLAGFFIAAVAAVALYRRNQQAEETAASAKEVQTATAVRMDLSSELTASSSLSPKNTYEVTSLVEGEILKADFEEGDIVEKGQILYEIDASSMDTDLSSAETSLLRAQENLASAKEDYQEAAAKISENTYRSANAGYIKTLYLKEGDKVTNGTKIADIYDDSMMKITVPFLSAEAEQILSGDTAAITIEDTGEVLSGIVTNVSSLETTLSGGRLVKNVTAEVTNPGGLTTTMEATMSVGEMVCSAEGTFQAKTEQTLSADLPGNGDLEVEALLVDEGSRVEPDAGLFTVTAKSSEKYRKNFEDSVESAEDSLKNAENKLENTKDTIEDYTITAPISGTIVTKNSKAGDKISRNSGSSTTMAVIYDLSAMTLEMSVDELDVSAVKTGQSVEITADAIDGVTFNGTVTNVSLQGSYSNGVTNYPVTVTLEETGDLRPGMNVDAKIILDHSEQALCVPVGALMRGNRIYVKNSGENGPETEQKAEQETKRDNVPEGFHAVTVETGIINDDYVEILSGLSEGDEVYIDPNAGSSTMNSWQMGPGGNMGGPGGNMGGPPNDGSNRGRQSGMR